MNAHHEKWLEPTTTNLIGRIARDFASSSVCEQINKESTHIDGGVLDLVLTNVPHVVGVPARQLEPQIIVSFLQYCAGATYSSLGV